MKKYNHKTNLFENIDQQKSYLLGFLWADGYISKNGYKIETTIKTTDFNNLYQIFEKTGDWKQYHRDRKSKQTGKIYNSSVIIYYGKKTYNFFYEYDYKIKSDTQPLKILNIIPNKFHKDFYRGYIDGDGSFSYYICSNGTTMTCKFNITSKLNQDWHFIEILFDKIGIKNYKIHRYERKSGNSSMIGISNKWDIIKLGDYLYKDSDNIRLERKYKKYLEIKNSNIQKSPPKWTKIDKQFLKENYRKFGVNYCAEKLNRSEKSIYKQVYLLFDNPNKWTKEDENYLLENYKNGIEHCVKKLCRTINSIKSKYKKLCHK